VWESAAKAQITFAIKKRKYIYYMTVSLEMKGNKAIRISSARIAL
jgi:hypothetical protein